MRFLDSRRSLGMTGRRGPCGFATVGTNGARYSPRFRRVSGLLVTLCLSGKILALQSLVGFADEELERLGFEAQVLPFAEAEFEVERKVPSLPRAPEPRDFAQEPPVVDDLH